MSEDLLEIGPTHWEEAAELSRLAFGGPAGGPPEPPDPGSRTFGLTTDGRLVGVATLRSYRQCWGGRAVSMGGVASVAVHPDARGRGAGSRLLTALLPEMASAGQVLSVLYPTATGIYRPLGWETVGSLDEVRLPTALLQRARSPAAAPDALHVRTAGVLDVPALAALWQAYAVSSEGLLRRDGPSFPEGALGALEHDVVALAEVADEPVGYLAYDRGRGYGVGAELHAWELVTASAAAAAALLRSLGSWDSAAPQLSWRGPVDALALALGVNLPPPYACRPWMLRIVDAPGAVATSGFAPAVRVDTAFTLVDPQMRAHEGPWEAVGARRAGRARPRPGRQGSSTARAGPGPALGRRRPGAPAPRGSARPGGGRVGPGLLPAAAAHARLLLIVRLPDGRRRSGRLGGCGWPSVRGRPEGPGLIATARLDRRTKSLTKRLRPGDIAVIDHMDLDRVSADALVACRVSAVVNAAASISGRYPNLGPEILVSHGIPLVDGMGSDLFDRLAEGAQVRLEGDTIYLGEERLASGVEQSVESVEAAMADARLGLATQLEAFAANTMEYLLKERDLLLDGVGVPEIRTDLQDRHVLIVVRGYDYKQDIATLRPYIREYKPILLGVDGGADALLEAGYKPHLIVGDMDSVSDSALRCGAEIVVHAYSDGRAPGLQRVLDLGVGAVTFPASGTSEDVAMLLADEKGASLIVAVGTHATLVEFLDKGRAGMSSTFLTRLRIGGKLVDAKGVSRLYRSRISSLSLVLLVLATLVAMTAAVFVSSVGRAYSTLLADQLHDFKFWLSALL